MSFAVRILFCTDPLIPARPDRAFVHEVEAAEAAGLTWSQVDFEALVAGDLTRALRRVDELTTPETAIYRGWMLRTTTYEALHTGLAARGWRLINDPAAYRCAHLLPEALPHLGDDTPRTVVVPLGPDFGWPAIHAALAALGSGPVLVKDFVKSRKHEWDDACFIRAADDRAEVERVAGNFIERQSDDLVGGLVFRAFESLVDLGVHPQSGMPLAREWRRFIADGRVLADSPAWELADRGDPPPEFDALARRVPSRFFTLDLAQRRSGDWTAIELGDGQVAGLPAQLEAKKFYKALADWDPKP